MANLGKGGNLGKNRQNGVAVVKERRQRVSEMYLKGKSQQQIADLLKVSQATINGDLQQLRDEWKEQSISNYDARLQEELRKLDVLEQEAWAGYQCSKGATTIKRERQGATALRSYQDTTVKKTPAGDVRFLEVVANIRSQRAKLLGLVKNSDLNISNTINWDAFVESEPTLDQCPNQCPIEAKILSVSTDQPKLEHKLSEEPNVRDED